MTRNSSPVSLFVLIVIAICVVLCAGAATSALAATTRSGRPQQQQPRTVPRKPLLNSTKPFWQLNRTTYLYQTEGPLANWGKLPFGRVALVSFDESSRRYLFAPANTTSNVLYSAHEADLIKGGSSLNFTKHVVTFYNARSSPMQQWVATTIGPHQCISRYFTPNNCNNYTATSAIVYYNGARLAVCMFKPGSAGGLHCAVGKASGAFLWVYPTSIAVSSVPLGAANRGSESSAIIVASPLSLFTIRPTSATAASFVTTPVPLYNTTGSLLPTGSNITNVWCLPRAFYDSLETAQSEKDRRHHHRQGDFIFGQQQQQQQIKRTAGPHGKTLFMNADCWAGSSEKYCDSNICPADLVHNLRAVPYSFVNSSNQQQKNVAMATPQNFYRIPGIMDALPTAAVYAPAKRNLYLGNPISVTAMRHNGAMQRFGGFNGALPAGNVLSGAWLDLSSAVAELKAMGAAPEDYAGLGDGVVFFGTGRGAIAKMPAASDNEAAEGEHRWKLLLGGRWLPGGKDDMERGMDVYAMAGGAGGRTVVAVTSTGISVFHAVVWTAALKAHHWESVFSPVHQRADGLFADNQLLQWGNIWTSTPQNTGNDGLWTGMRLAQEAYRFAVTGAEDARANCWKNFDGLELLVNVTGIPGVMARSAFYGSRPDPTWIKSPSMAGWYFMGNASSDEVCGHFAGRAALYALVAQTTEEKARVRDSTNAIMRTIVDHGLRLVQGTPTQWGVWDPKQLVFTPFWYDDAGVNTVQIMGWLAWTWQITGNQTYYDTFVTLRDQYGYGSEMVNAKITQPTDVNYSDDELLFMAYLPWFFITRTAVSNPLFESVAQQLAESLEREWRYIKRSKPSLWAALYAAMQPAFDIDHEVGPSERERELEAARESIWRGMVETPVDYVDWPIDNSQRLGIWWNPNSARNGQANVVLENLFALDELSMFQWNGNPYRAQQGSGWDEARPTGFLFPYWAAMAADMWNN